ncbi:flagellar biosynthesis anti-sigma factor FlgM [Campylobacter mucosalis]|uniref:flagellar biosynthesis anti-sigma factor FlgM n=1 Tax=Campylobacter mucosalis TaxID=202 RepID=UPI0004D7C396|nr:flagellar biosynthesis anti-sigma factor FlgM [Campylobacter mucosalis]KEA46509.1 flagellar biosynthesis anti-sigma factor FlgM [Campylobacter mucosalis]QKF62993.1 anti-sigma factor FlgM [Campylobacter mucosalis]
MISSLSVKSGVQTNLLNKTNDVKKEPSVEVNKKEESRVAKIASAIADGSYELDMKKTAKAIADTLL